MSEKHLFIVDGMPGSGKTTYSTAISNLLDMKKIKHRCVLELEQEHPLLYNYIDFSDLSYEDAADHFMSGIEEKYTRFVTQRLEASDHVTIIESALFQKTISFAYHIGMDRDKIHALTMRLLKILEPLNPALIFFHQVDVEGQWRYICNIRGNIWGSFTFHTEEDFKEAGRLWSESQSYIRGIIDTLNIPKLIIENSDYHWDEYSQRINYFVKITLEPTLVSLPIFMD